MILDNADAEGRGCPLRVITRHLTLAEIEKRKQGDLPLGSLPTVTTFASCLHEQCMAWRWEDGCMDKRRLPDMYYCADANGKGLRGYCGLAGVPALLRDPPDPDFP